MHRANPQPASDPGPSLFIINSIFKKYAGLLEDFLEEATQNGMSRDEKSTKLGQTLLSKLNVSINLLKTLVESARPTTEKQQAELLLNQINSVHDVLESFDHAIEQRTGIALPKIEEIKPFAMQRAALLWQLRALGSRALNGSNLSLVDAKGAAELNEAALKEAEAKQREILQSHTFFTNFFKRKNIKDILHQIKNPADSIIIKHGETSDYDCVQQKLDALIMSLDMNHFPKKIAGENGRHVLKI